MIATGTALIGSALIGGATALNSASQAKKANNKAIEANNTATAQQLAAQDKALDVNVGLNSRFVDGGGSAFDQLLTRYGLSPSGAAAKPAGGYAGTSPLQGGGAPTGGTAVPQTPQRSPAETQAYLQQWPDLAAEAQNVVGPGKQFQTPEQYLEWHDDNFASEGRDYTPPVQQQGPAPGPTGPQTPTDMMTAQRPAAAAAPTFGSAPTGSGLSWDDFKNSDAYNYVFDEAMRGGNAKWAGRGLLKSDAAFKGAQDRAAGLSSQNYFNYANLNLAKTAADRGQFNQDRATGLTQYNNDTARNDNIFQTDRNYQTNRYDTDTGNLFDLTNIGLRAAGNVSGANADYAANTGNIFGAQANNAANAAANRAQANSQLGGAIGGAATSALNYFAGGGNPQPYTAQTVNANPYTAMPNFNTNGFSPSSFPTYQF